MLHVGVADSAKLALPFGGAGLFDPPETSRSYLVSQIAKTQRSSNSIDHGYSGAKALP